MASGATSKTAPLTKQNLKLLRQQTIPAKSGKDTDPSTSVKSTAKSTSSSFEKDLWNARRILALNGMHLEEPSSRARYPQVAEEIGRLLIDRNSEKKRNMEHLKETFERFGWSNEITLEANVMPLLKGIERSVTQQDRNGEPMEVQKPWLKDHLGENWDFPFIEGVLQTLKRGTLFEQKVFDAILEKYPKLKNPRPDIIYGPWASAFSEEEQFVNEQFIEFSMASESLYHSAFIWEWKSAKGNLEESRLQACRATAAVGYAIRNFQRCIGINPDDHMVDDVDLTSLVYAMCIDNQIAYMYAGFYVREGASVGFRFVPFRDYPFYMNANALSNLRQDVHNVLDWIVGERVNWIKRLIGEYIEREKAKLAAAAESSTPVALGAANVGASTGEAASPSGSHANKRQRTGKEQSTQTDT